MKNLNEAVNRLIERAHRSSPQRRPTQLSQNHSITELEELFDQPHGEIKTRSSSKGQKNPHSTQKILSRNARATKGLFSKTWKAR